MASISKKINLLPFFTTLAIFLIPFGVLASFSPIPAVRFYVLDFVVVLIFVVRIINRLMNHPPRLFHPVFVSLFVFGGFAFLALLLNNTHLSPLQFQISFLYWLRFAFYGNLLIIPFLMPKASRNKIPMQLFVTGVIFTLFGYFQYFFYSDLRNLYYLGWDEHLHRFFSTFLDPNFAAAFLVLTFVLGLGLLFQDPMNFSLRSKDKRQWILLIGNVLILPAIFLTYSRSGLIMLGVSIVTFLILLRQLKWIVLSAVILGIGLFFVPKNLGGEGVNLLRTASINSRLESYERGIEIFKSSPIYGVGFNAYRYAQIDRNFIDKNPETNHAGAGVSNSWLFVLATTGIIGFALYLFFWFQVFKSTTNGSDPSKNNKSKFIPGLTRIDIIMVSCLSGLFVEAFFENSLFYNFIMVWLFLMIGVVVAERKN